MPTVQGVLARIRERREALQLARFHAHLRRLGVTIGEHCYISRGTIAGKNVSFGRGTRVGPSFYRGREPIRLGNYCIVGREVRMISSNHKIDQANLQIALQRRLGMGNLSTARGPIEVGNNVWIGDASIILTGVTIGDGAVVGAGSVVTKDIPPFAIAVGSPARVIRMRFVEEEIERLQELAWWNWSEDEMREHPEVFETALSVGPSLVAPSAG